MSLLICHFRFLFFFLETLKFEWQCSQYLGLYPTCVLASSRKYARHGEHDLMTTRTQRFSVLISMAIRLWHPRADTLGRHPPGRHPPEQTPPPSRSRHHSPWEQTPSPPGADTPPWSSACWEIRATSRQYASYWNGYLLNSIYRINRFCRELF